MSIEFDEYEQLLMTISNFLGQEKVGRCRRLRDTGWTGPLVWLGAGCVWQARSL